MKFLLPAALALFAVSCSTLKPEPKPGTADHQAWLAEQARENFLALKRAEQKERPGAQQAESSEPKPVAIDPFYKRSVFKPTPPSTPPPTPRFTPTRKADDTVYIWDQPRTTAPSTSRFTPAEIRYARELAKRPEDLTSEERLWARNHYR